MLEGGYMSAWMLVQIIFNLVFGAVVFIVVKKINRNPKDDPRLSRGLQLLQSKIAILEDLADRTEVQVKQLTTLIDQKTREVQTKIQAADKQIRAIEASMEKSLEVAKIFQDRIPHEEIIERQNTMKYIQAARLAHRGMSADQIREEIDLPSGELDFIVKINRNQLMFADDDLPAWAHAASGASAAVASDAVSITQSGASVSRQGDNQDAEMIAAQDEFSAVSTASTSQGPQSATGAGSSLAAASVATDNRSPADNPEQTLAKLGERFRRVQFQQSEPENKGVTIRKVEFPRLETP